MDQRQRIIDENEYLLKLWFKSQTGDKVAFCQLAETQYRSLFSYATNFTDDREFIKDSIQNIFIRIWEKRASLTIQFVSIYLFKSLRNELMQEFRRSKQPFSSVYSQEVSELSDWQTVETEIEQTETDSESQRRIRQAIDTLPKRQQEAVFLKFYKGLENDQIAELMDINRQSVANLLYKALVALKSQMTFFNYWVITLVLLT
ncbi:sigma-70 family RNA polymerase sigma factor [Spirosoma taeanense]|uniref:Sigma-70 family RNA polymerase sigma factor n=1 Tax=Spirosoma taeanense TaxID=2735870 RepID=A0A6M5Y9W1_9BACT|nr:sigma-70 family RNA polymerase sigma factor [Spirosoma taeanense]QJW90011.1 sigma-70 family RNA polymerase sigma factor [Spirosoma taeanense]